MQNLFEDRRTEAGRAAIYDLVNHISDHPYQFTMILKEHSIDISNWGWVSPFAHLLMGEHETALLLTNRYLSESQKIQGDNAQEIANGHYLLILIRAFLRRGKQEMATGFQESHSIRGRFYIDMESHMMITLYALAEAHHRQNDVKSVQRAFLTALLALFLMSIAPEAMPRDIAKDLSYLIQSLGFPANLCGWLIRRSHIFITDFIGLVSVLIDEGLFPSGATDSDELSAIESDEETLATEYEIVLMEDSEWKLPEGFSKEFPASVAKGELSMRVEECLREARRCIEITGHLTNVWLVFSSRSTGGLITIFGSDTRSEGNETLKRIVAENGADSAMILEWIDVRSDELLRSLALARGAHEDNDIMIMAKDAKGPVMGAQSANLIEGKYVFEEPIVTAPEEDWFLEFEFPVQPAVDKQPKRIRRQ